MLDFANLSNVIYSTMYLKCPIIVKYDECISQISTVMSVVLTPPATHLKCNRYRPAFVSHSSCFAVKTCDYLLSLLYSMYSWKGSNKVAEICFVLFCSGFLHCIFTHNWTVWRRKAVRSKETERSKNSATLQPVNTLKLSKQDAAAMTVWRREAVGSHIRFI